MDAVVEVDKIGNIVNLVPLDRVPGFPTLPEECDFLAVTSWVVGRDI
jgi:hypothetical protein